MSKGTIRIDIKEKDGRFTASAFHVPDQPVVGPLIADGEDGDRDTAIAKCKRGLNLVGLGDLPTNLDDTRRAFDPNDPNDRRVFNDPRNDPRNDPNDPRVFDERRALDDRRPLDPNDPRNP